MKGRYVPSLLAAIGEVIERHMISVGFLKAPGQLAEDQPSQLAVVNMDNRYSDEGGDDNNPKSSGPGFRQCPKCAQLSLMRQEGCDTCTSCGYSKCG